MALPGFFKIPQHSKFDIVTRFYDADKEDLERRIRRAEIEKRLKDEEDDAMEESDESSYSPKIKGRMNAGYYKRIQRQKRQSNFRLFVILAALLLLAYYLLT